MKRKGLAVLSALTVLCFIMMSGASAESEHKNDAGIVQITTDGQSETCHISYQNAEGQIILDQDGFMNTVQMRGPETPQKTILITGKFNVRLFANRDEMEYHSFLLRNAGYDGMLTHLLDGFQSRLLDTLCDTVSVLYTAWCPVSVYIDSEYMGCYQLQENPDSAFILTLSKYSQKDAVTILEGNGTLISGTEEDRQDYLNLVATLPMLDLESAISLIEKEIDVDSYLSYIAMSMFVGNSDIGCVRWYRISGEKWKWLWCNADWCLYDSGYNSPSQYLKLSGMGAQNIDNTLLKVMLSSDIYRDRFLQKLGRIFQSLSTETMLSVLQPIVDEMYPLMKPHWLRWSSECAEILDIVPSDGDKAFEYWEHRINRLRNTLEKRPGIVRQQIQEQFELTDERMIFYFGK